MVTERRSARGACPLQVGFWASELRQQPAWFAVTFRREYSDFSLLTRPSAVASGMSSQCVLIRLLLSASPPAARSYLPRIWIFATRPNSRIHVCASPCFACVAYQLLLLKFSSAQCNDFPSREPSRYRIKYTHEVRCLTFENSCAAALTDIGIVHCLQW